MSPDEIKARRRLMDQGGENMEASVDLSADGLVTLTIGYHGVTMTPGAARSIAHALLEIIKGTGESA